MTAEECQNAQLLEQYKSYMDNLNSIGQHHSQTRAFYVSIISALLVFLAFAGSTDAMFKISIVGQFSVGILGIIICAAWYIHAISFSKLFAAKFRILKRMEKKLPFKIFTVEWKILTKTGFTPLMKIESYVSLAIAVPFIMLLQSLGQILYIMFLHSMICWYSGSH